MKVTKTFNTPCRLFTIVSVMLIVAALGCLEIQAQTQPLKLAIGYIPHIQFAPLYVGIEKGFYQEQQVALEIEYGFGIDIFALLAQEKIDIGLADSDQLVLAGAKDMGLVALLQYYQKYPVTIVAKQDTVQTPDDFRGQRIGTPQMQGTSFIGLQLFLKQHNLQKQVTIEKIGYTQIPSLMGDKIEGAVCFFNNEPIKLKQLGVQLNQWDLKDFSDIVGASFITSQALTDKKTDVLKRFTQATIKAMEYTCQHQPEALQIALPYINQQEKPDEPFLRDVLAATCQLFESPEGYGALSLDTYNFSIQTLHALGLIENVYPAEKIVYDRGH